ncbi:PaRep2b protein [Pyrobaculum oguniense TE7]|uniref:PaRep2b protein n=1 Tax=Pyrobaculum oguniense (strain DSM 13380 / JCM 10595 / TE7) TaxID=698757 RepID=H6Q9P0_PYROT|nr:PaRep2b protein [Pyrobaculum oguniense TE7]
MGKAHELFKKASLEEGRDYTVYSGQGVIRLTVPEALWTIAWRAKKGDEKAEKALGQLLEAAERLGIRQYFKERIRLVLMAGTKNAVGKKMTLEEKGITVEITGFKVELVSFEDPNKTCNRPAELCRRRVTIRYKIGDKEQEFTVAWGVGEENTIRASVRINALYRAAALIAVAIREGDEEEKKNRIINRARRGSTVTPSFDNPLAMAQYDASLLGWAMEIRRRGNELRREKGKSTRETRRYKTL